jgi:hypothetical protein
MEFCGEGRLTPGRDEQIQAHIKPAEHLFQEDISDGFGETKEERKPVKSAECFLSQPYI